MYTAGEPFFVKTGQVFISKWLNSIIDLHQFFSCSTHQFKLSYLINQLMGINVLSWPVWSVTLSIQVQRFTLWHILVISDASGLSDCSGNVCVDNVNKTWEEERGDCRLVKVTDSNTRNLLTAMKYSSYWIGLRRFTERRWINGIVSLLVYSCLWLNIYNLFSSLIWWNTYHVSAVVHVISTKCEHYNRWVEEREL